MAAAKAMPATTATTATLATLERRARIGPPLDVRAIVTRQVPSRSNRSRGSSRSSQSRRSSRLHGCRRIRQCGWFPLPAAENSSDADDSSVETDVPAACRANCPTSAHEAESPSKRKTRATRRLSHRNHGVLGMSGRNLRLWREVSCWRGWVLAVVLVPGPVVTTCSAALRHARPGDTLHCRRRAAADPRPRPTSENSSDAADSSVGTDVSAACRANCPTAPTADYSTTCTSFQNAT
jgi:hypothetical protein